MEFCTDGALGLEVCDVGTLCRCGRESAGWLGQSVRTVESHEEIQGQAGAEAWESQRGAGLAVVCVHHTARGKQQASWPPAPTCRH